MNKARARKRELLLKAVNLSAYKLMRNQNGMLVSLRRSKGTGYNSCPICNLVLAPV